MLQGPHDSPCEWNGPSCHVASWRCHVSDSPSCHCDLLAMLVPTLRRRADEGGMYQGKIKFPDDYPFKPPSIYMLTPNGRFETDRRLCLSISDFHPESWIPTWSVASIINGVLSFMLEDAPTTGSVATSLAEKRRLVGIARDQTATRHRCSPALNVSVCSWNLAGGAISDFQSGRQHLPPTLPWPGRWPTIHCKAIFGNGSTGESLASCMRCHAVALPHHLTNAIALGSHPGGRGMCGERPTSCSRRRGRCCSWWWQCSSIGERTDVAGQRGGRHSGCRGNR